MTNKQLTDAIRRINLWWPLIFRSLELKHGSNPNRARNLNLKISNNSHVHQMVSSKYNGPAEWRYFGGCLLYVDVLMLLQLRSIHNWICFQHVHNWRVLGKYLALYTFFATFSAPSLLKQSGRSSAYYWNKIWKCLCRQTQECSSHFACVWRFRDMQRTLCLRFRMKMVNP